VAIVRCSQDGLLVGVNRVCHGNGGEWAELKAVLEMCDGWHVRQCLGCSGRFAALRYIR